MAHSTHQKPTSIGEIEWEGSMKVGDVMTPDIEVLNPGDSLRTAAQLMANLDLEALPVSENNRLTGMITGRDIAIRVVAKSRGAAEITVREAMSFDVLYCFESEPISDIAQKMNDWWVRRLPVVNENNRLIGIVSLADVTSLQAAAPTTRVVGEPSQRLRAARSKGRIRPNRRAAVAA
jgi:CBS domain-containing protein